jgi:hypothetical protein
VQILYAAPFLLLAAISFFVSASIPRLRVHALVIPVGFLTFGVGALITFIVFAFVAERLGYKGNLNWFFLAPYIVGGLLVATACTSIYKAIVAVLPLWVIRAGLLIGSLCSALVLSFVINIAAASYMPSTRPLWTLGVIAFATLYATASIVSNAALFRPRPLSGPLQRIIQPSTIKSSNSSI